MVTNVHFDIMHMGITHQAWDTVMQNRMDVMRAITKVRILTGTYMYLLQSHRKKFKMEGVVDAICPLWRLSQGGTCAFVPLK